MNLILAFAALDAGSSRQRARCAKTGRFVAWSKAAPLRRAVAGQVLFVPQTTPLSTEVEVVEVEAPLVEAIDTAAAGPLGGGVAVATAGAVALVAAATRSAAAAVRTLAGRLAGAGRRLVAGLRNRVAPRQEGVTLD